MTETAINIRIGFFDRKRFKNRLASVKKLIREIDIVDLCKKWLEVDNDSIFKMPGECVL